MRMNPCIFVAASSAALLLCGCKKSSPAPASVPADANPAPSGAEAASLAPPSAPRNPALKIAPPGPPVVVNGVTVNVQNAEKALASVPYQLHLTLANVRYALRYEDFRTAVADLQKVAADPSLNEDQRRVVG